MAQNRNYHRKKKKNQAVEDNYIPPYDAMLLSEPIEILGLNEQVATKLKSRNVDTLLEVVKRRGKDFYKIPTFNKKDLFELKRRLDEKRLAFRPEEVIEKQEEKKEDANIAKPQKTNDNRQSRQNKEQNNKKVQKSAAKDNKKNDRRDRRDNNNREKDDKRRQQRPIVVMPQDIYVKINKNGKWGFADRNGKEVIPPKYDEVFSFKDEVCCVEKDELFGYIDRNGDEIIPIIYECATSFNEGYACVYKNGHCGYINKENQVIIDFKFDAGTMVEDGNCRVKRDGKWGEMYIDKPLEIRWIN